MKTKINFKTGALLVPLIFFGCHNAKRSVETETRTPVTEATSSTVAPAGPDAESTSDTIVYDRTIFPTENLFKTKILTPGTFHADEIEASVHKVAWMGLYRNKENFYLAPAKIYTSRIFDPILDEDTTQRTGWEVTVTGRDTCFLLIEPLPYLTSRQVKHVQLPKSYLLPGDTIRLNFSGQDYQLFATGGKKKSKFGLDGFEVFNYKLYLTSRKEGQQLTELLAAQPFFEENMITVLFAGDIDGDGFLDLLIDTSNHYNAFSPTLYLSKPAGNHSLLKVIGSHTSVGC